MRKHKWHSVVDNPSFSFRAAWASSGWTPGERAVVAGLILFFLALLGGLVVAAGAMFQYSLWSIFGKDVPFLLDVLGGLALNALTIPVFVACLIARACGVPTPFVS